MVALGNRVSEQLSRLGIPAEMVGAQLGHLSTTKLTALSNDLQVSFGKTALAANKFMGETQDARWNIAPALTNPTPKDSMKDRGRLIGGTYSRNAAMRHSSSKNPFPGLMNKYSKQGVIMSRMLNRDSVARGRFEKQAALTVVTDGRTDGAVAVHAMNTGGSTSSGGVPGSAWDMFAAMDEAILREAAKMGNVASAGAEIYGSSDYGNGSQPAGYFGGMGDAGSNTFSNGSFTSTTEGSTGNTGSMDEQSLVIKRMMDKRNQMYDLFKNVLDKHNESAKTAIGNMRA